MPATGSLGLDLRRAIPLDPATADANQACCWAPLAHVNRAGWQAIGSHLHAPVCTFSRFELHTSGDKQQAASSFSFIIFHYLAISVLEEPLHLFVRFQSESRVCFVSSR